MGSRILRTVVRSRGLRVLNFHRVLPDDLPADDYRRRMGDPTVSEFRRLLERITSGYRVVSLRDYVRRLHGERSRRLLVALTFDDGYMDNLTNALPVLTEFRVPATVFVSSDAMDGRKLWFQRIHLLVNAVDVPEIVTPWDGKKHRTDDRAQAMDSIADSLKQYPISRVHECLDALEQRYGRAVTGLGEDTEEMMAWGHLGALRANGLVEIGSHTVSHPNLRLLDDESLDRELGESLEAIRARTQEREVMLAYPNARYDARVAAAARRAGYAAGFTMDPGLNTAETDLFAMHREYLRHGVDGVDLQLAGM